MRRPGWRVTSPSNSSSTPAMIRSTVDFPDPFRPSSPIFAPWKKEREMSLMICRLGGTILLTRIIDMTYGGMMGAELSTGRRRPQGEPRPPRGWYSGGPVPGHGMRYLALASLAALALSGCGSSSTGGGAGAESFTSQPPGGSVGNAAGGATGSPSVPTTTPGATPAAD